MTSALAAYPELVPERRHGPVAAVPGQQITVGWTLTNRGSATADRAVDRAGLAGDRCGGRQPDPGRSPSRISGSLAAGQSVSRSANVTVPDLPAGTYWFVVIENPFGEVFELNTANNTAVAASAHEHRGDLDTHPRQPNRQRCRRARRDDGHRDTQHQHDQSRSS